MSRRSESLVLGPGQGWVHSQDRSCRLDPSRKERDIFPLPCPPEVCQEHGLSRRSQQRLDRKMRILADVREAVQALNWMNGFSPTSEFNCEPDPMQKQVLERMVHLSRVAAYDGAGPTWKPEAALQELLRGKTEYESPGLPISLARFDIERISLPETLEDVPDVLDILPEEARHFLKSPEHMLRSEPVVDELITPYWDPLLKNNKSCYKALIKKLHSIGYLRYTRKPMARAGIFFVHKSDKKKIRMIVDARPANQLFGSPPGVQLCTSEGFARIEMEVPSELTPGTEEFRLHLKRRGLVFGLSDVKDCFHRLRQPEWLSRYFAWDEVPVSWVPELIGTEVEGHIVKKGDWLHPMPVSLCMGFSWSLYFAQKCNEHLMSKVPSIIGSKIISDRSETVAFTESETGLVRHYVYVDNLGIISQDEGIVKDSLAELGPMFDDRGLVLHPGEIQKDDVRALGCQMRGDLLAVRITPERYWKLRRAIEAIIILRRKKVSGRILEVVLGHITFCCLCNRQLLCIFAAIYKYIRRQYFIPERLWPSVRRELEVFRGLMIYLQTDWWKPWNNLVSSSDSSLEGYGVSVSYWDPEVVASCGRRLERARFRRPATTAARDHALTSAGFVKDEVTDLWKKKLMSDEDLLKESGWEANPDFEEIPSHLLAKSKWEPKLWGKWSFEGQILELEGRALVKSLRRVATSVFGSDIRQLLLADNMSVALSFDRYRSRSYPLLKQIRRFSSYLLSRNITAVVRWIPSEFNSSDEPSRFYSEEPSKLLTHLLGHEEHAEQPASGFEAAAGQEEKDSGAKETCSFLTGGQTGQAPEEFGVAKRSPEGVTAKPKGQTCPSFSLVGHRSLGAVAFLEPDPQTGEICVQFQQCHQRWTSAKESFAQAQEEDVSRAGGWGHEPDQLDPLRREGCWRTDSESLQGRTGQFCQVWQTFGPECERLGEPRQKHCGVPEQAVCAGVPSLQGRPPSSCSPPFLPAVWQDGQQEAATHVASPTGLQEVLPWEDQIGLPPSDLGRGCCQAPGNGATSHGRVFAGGRIFLCKALGIVEDEGLFFGATFNRHHQLMEPAALPRRSSRTVQKRRLRCVHRSGFPVVARMERHDLQLPEARSPRRPLVGFRLQRVQQGVRQDHGLFGAGEHHPLPDSPLRSVNRPGR